ncbi:MAG TPA: MlaA family lipoprotein [Steroidobacteraceae bacterium]
MQKTIRLSALSMVLLALLGCAAAPAKKDPRDPWERMNRGSYKFTNAVDKAVLRPIAHGYQNVTPHFVRTGVSNFFDNLGYPLVIVNDLLQFRLKTFTRDTGRLLINTTLGVGGLLDPATPAGLEKTENDFGLTFGRWGIPQGPYFFIPLLGPSDVRDGLGRIPAAYLSPQNYVSNNWVKYSVWAVSLLDARYRLLPTDPLIDSAYDPYLFVKNAYLQRRDYLLSKGSGTPSKDESDADKLLDEATQDDQSDQQPAPAPGEIKPEEPKPQQSKPDQEQSTAPQAASDQANSDQAKPDRANPNRQQEPSR